MIKILEEISMKPIAIILIISLLSYCFGCYNTTFLKNKKDFQNSYDMEGKIYVETKKGITYFYGTNMYTFGDDTLYGEGQMVAETGWKNDPESIKIAYLDIDRIKIKQFDSTRTRICTFITVNIILGLIYAAVRVDFSSIP